MVQIIRDQAPTNSIYVSQASIHIGILFERASDNKRGMVYNSGNRVWIKYTDGAESGGYSSLNKLMDSVEGTYYQLKELP